MERKNAWKKYSDEDKNNVFRKKELITWYKKVD